MCVILSGGYCRVLAGERAPDGLWDVQGHLHGGDTRAGSCDPRIYPRIKTGVTYHVSDYVVGFDMHSIPLRNVGTLY